MEVRRLSPASFWIGIPLTQQTPDLMWRAMRECGIIKGKIRSYSTTHFVPVPNEDHYVVQGTTPLGPSSYNVLIQAHLRDVDGGTEVQMDAANARGDFDFGKTAQLKREYTANLESFFRRVPADWEQRAEAGTLPAYAPIASPTSPPQNIYVRYEAPEYGPVVPFDHEAPYHQLRYVLFTGGLYIAYVCGIALLVMPLLWCWMVWGWIRGQKVAWWELFLLTGGTIYEVISRFTNWL